MLKQYIIRFIPFLSAMIIAFTACNDNLSPNDSDYRYQVPEESGDGWTVASMASVGMDESVLEDLMDNLVEYENHYINSILVVRHGQLVFEEYFPGVQIDLITDNDRPYEEVLVPVPVSYDRNTLQYQGSVSKGFTSVLVGIAIDRGFISGIDEKLFSFFPEHADLNDEQRDKITIQHMLTMTSGLDWHDDDIDGEESDEIAHFVSSHPDSFVLSLDMLGDPGTVYDYNSGTTCLLGEIIHRTSSMSLQDFAQQYLFTPLNIDSYHWVTLPNDSDYSFASGGLYLTPRAMAKFGQLYLQRGTWEGNQVIPATWIDSTLTPWISMRTGTTKWTEMGFGYHWFLGVFGDYDYSFSVTQGWGGQFIFIIPEVDLVVVFTGGNYEANSPTYSDPFNAIDLIVSDYILDAIE
ncbi:serine hydrolase domain-containing protein [Candidatus Neomarinimicrobiota bacterium]